MSRAWVCAPLLLFLACSSDEGGEPKATGGATTGGTAGGSAGGVGGAGGGSGGVGAGGSVATGGSGGGPSGYDCKNPHPAWLLCEDFEGMSAGFSAWLAASKWTDHIGGDDAGRMTTSNEAHGGGFALYLPAAASSGYQGADLLFRTCQGQNQPGCAMAGYDRLFFRAWFRLAPDHQKVHHFLSILGSEQYWDAYGNAGCRPDGTRHMGTTVDFEGAARNTFFYTYFPEMSCDTGANCSKYADPTQICADCAQKGMPCANGPECCWGNEYHPSPEVTLPLDQWVCLEMSMKANDPGQKNGEMSYSIDGKLAHQVTGMSFRTKESLKLNGVRLQHYLTTEDAAGHSNRIWFDDVVVSTEPIGCS